VVTAEELLIRRIAHLLLKSRGGTYQHNEKDAKAMVARVKDEWRRSR
jgi:predicted SprT family Zn-dependent metalloprotease